MAGTLETRSPEAPHYVDYEEYVDFQLEKTRSSIKLTDIFTTLTILAVAVIGYLLVFVVFDQWILDGGFGYASRVVLLSVLMTAVVGMLTWRVFFPLIRRVHPLYAARVIELADPNLKSNLVNFVDVRDSNARATPAVLKAMEKRAAVGLSRVDVDEAVDRRPLLRIAYALLGVVVAAALYIILSPKDAFTSVRRALLPTAAIDVATETTITDVTPQDTEVPARTRLSIEAEVRGKDADRAHILYTTADHKYVDEVVEMKRVNDGMPRFRGELMGENGRGLLQSLTYRIVAGDAHKGDYKVTVIQPPSARVDEVQYEYPTYMQLEKSKTQDGNIDGWEGTKVTVTATTNVPVKTATIVLTEVDDANAKGEEFSMQVADGTKLSATWKLDFREDGTAPRYYHIDVKTAKDETDPAPTQYTLRIRPDQRPEVALLAPTTDLDMPANGVIPLVIQATDPDFQLRSITLKIERSGDVSDQKLFVDQTLGQTYRGNHDFRLEPLRLEAGKTIQFWIEVKDNKQPMANRANTPRINVHIGNPASAEAVKQELEKEKQKQQEELNRADDANNPEKAEDLPPPRDNEDDAKPADPQPRPDPGEDPQKNQRRDADREPENAQDPPDQPNDEQQPGQQKKSTPDNFQQALDKLLRKEQQKQDAGQKQDDDQKQQPGDEQADKKQSDKTPPDKTQNDKKGGRDSAKADPSQADDKNSSNKNSTGNRSDEKNQKPASKSQSDSGNNDKSKSKTGNSDNKNSDNNNDQASRNENSSEKSGGQGNTDDKNKKDPSAKPQGNGAQNSPKSDDPKAGDQKGDDPKSGDPKANDSKSGDPRNGDPKSTEQGQQGDDKKSDSPAKGDDQGDKKKEDGPGDSSKADNPETAGDKPRSDKPVPDKPSPDDQPSADQKNQNQGGAGKQSTESDPASNPKDGQKGDGSRNQTDKPEGDQQQGEGSGEKSQKTAGDPKKTGNDADPNGEKKPSADSPDAKQKKADGTETGDATGDKDGDPQAPKAQNDVKKKEGGEAGARQPSSDPSQTPKKPDERGKQPNEGAKGSSADPDKATRAPDGKKDSEQTGATDDPQSQPNSDIKKDPKSENRPDQPPNAGNPPLKGPGRKDGQKSEGSDTGEQGSAAATDQGKKGANQQGGGDKSDDEGNTDKASKETGQAGSEKGKGSTTKPSDQAGKKESGAGENAGDKSSTKDGQGKQGDKPGESGDGKASSQKPSGDKGQGKEGGQKGQAGQKGDGEKEGGQSGQKGGQGESGKSDGKPSDGKASGESSSPGKPGKSGQSKSGAGAFSPPGDGQDAGDKPGGASDAEPPKPRDASKADDPPSPEEDEANLEYARKASNLVLQRLKSQLERGEVDQEMLDELGWKDKKDVERLVKFLEQGLNAPADDNSPEAVARRLQFEETLKSLRLGNDTGRREEGEGKSRTIRQVGRRDVPVPPEYRKWVESYTRSLSKQSEPAKVKDKKK